MARMQAHISTPLKKTGWLCLAGLVVCCLLVRSLQGEESTPEGAQAEEAKKDLKALHTVMVKYLEANEGVWPTMPDEVVNATEESVAYAWMIKILKDHGATDEDLRLSFDTSDRPMSYSMTDFERAPMTAYRWRAQPWFIVTVPTKPLYMITAEGRPARVKEISELKPIPGDPNGYTDPEFEGLCPIEAVPVKLRPIFETASKSWKDKQ